MIVYLRHGRAISVQVDFAFSEGEPQTCWLVIRRLTVVTVSAWPTT